MVYFRVIKPESASKEWSPSEEAATGMDALFPTIAQPIANSLLCMEEFVDDLSRTETLLDEAREMMSATSLEGRVKESFDTTAHAES